MWEVSNVILKFGFTRAFGATVQGDAKNIMYREFAMYLLSFFVEIKKNVIIKLRLKCTILIVCFFWQVWNRTWQTYSSVTQVVYSGTQESISKWKKNHIFADDVRVDYFSLLHCSWIWRTEPYCYSLVVWVKSVAPYLTYCKIFENFTGSYLMCTGF